MSGKEQAATFVITEVPPVAGTLGGSSQSGGFRTTDLDNSGAFVPGFWDGGQVTSTLDASVATKRQTMPEKDRLMAAIVPVFTGDGVVADPLTANEGSTYTHEGSRNFRMHNVVGQAVDLRNAAVGPIAQTLQAGGMGDDRGVCPNAIPHTIVGRYRCASCGEVFDDPHAAGVGGLAPAECPACGEEECIGFTAKDYGQDAAAELAPTLRAGVHGGSHANGGVMPAVAFKASHFTRGKDGAPSQVFPPLTADADKGDQDPVVLAPAFDMRLHRFLCPCGRRFGIDDYERNPQCPACGNAEGLEDACDRDPVKHADALQAAGEALSFEARVARNGRGAPSDVVNALKAQAGGTGKGDAAPLVFGVRMLVRRLMPSECELLQGFPKGHTLVPYRGKLMSDGPRYKALGNSWAVPCARWIGRRMDLLEELCPTP